MKDLYQVLGVDRSASQDDIKRAFRRLASQHHPDKGGDKERFQDIQQAYAVLGDEAKRREYDNPPQSVHFNFGGGNPFDFDAIFDAFGTRLRPRQRPRFARMSLWISLRDVIQGGRRPVSVATAQGTSMVEIEIPPAIDDGNTIQYHNLAPGGGDLLVTFRIQPHARWQRQGLDLISEELVSVWDLILGCDLMIIDALDNQLSIKVPAGTQPGSSLRLRGRGLRDQHGKQGDLLVRVQGRLPQTISEQLTSEIKRETGR